MDEDFVLNCKQNELLVDGKCIPFSDVEKEVRSLVFKRDRSHDDNVRLAILYDALKSYLIAIEQLEKQLYDQKYMVSKMYSSIYSWWYGDDRSKKSGAHSSRVKRNRRKHHSSSTRRKRY